MTTHKLPVREILTNALFAPFSLEAASWKALAKPGLALAIASLSPLVAKYFQWGGTAAMLSLLSVWAAIVWFAVDFQRHLLQGAVACKSEPTPWQRYGLYLLALVIVSILLAVLAGMLLYMVLPAIVYFTMAINSPSPWLATGTVVMWIMVAGVAAYPVLHFTLMLPAVTVGHDITPGRIWRLSRCNGLRLLLLLIVIPGLLNGMLYFAFEEDSSSTGIEILAGLLNSYFVLLILSILALAYRHLSDQQLPAVNRTPAAHRLALNARVLWPVVLIVLTGLGGTLIWNALYRVEPGVDVAIFRHGKPVRIESDPGIHARIPVLEDAQPVPTGEMHRTQGMGRFMTKTKDTLSLSFDTRWRVADMETYARTTAGQSRLVEMRIDELANNILKNQVAMLSQDDMRRLLNAGTVEFSVIKAPHHDAPLDGVLENINFRTRELGIEITAWRIETSSQHSME